MIAGAQLVQEAGLVFSSSDLGNVTPGTSFYINGTILQNCERYKNPLSINDCLISKQILYSRFAINLTLGLQSKDIALHINPRLPQNYIVRNCKINGHWGKEEVTSPLPFALKRGCPFAIQVLVTESEYYISVDGRHFASFRHRIPYGRVTCLQVVGDVTDVEVEQLPVMQYPDRVPDEQKNIVETVEFFNEDNVETNRLLVSNNFWQ